MDFAERNPQHVNMVLDISMLSTRQDIPLRDHKETEEAQSGGNLSVFQVQSKNTELKLSVGFRSFLEIRLT